MATARRNHPYAELARFDDVLIPGVPAMNRHARETIRHVAWTEAEIRSALRAAGFGRIRTFDGADVRPESMGTPRWTDLHVLAERTGR